MFGRRPNGYSKSNCKPCEAARARAWHANNKDWVRRKNRETALKRYYGITPEQYAQMLELQDGKCLVCGSTGNSESDTPLAVDHCHDTMRIRGLLCAPCNMGLGHFRDDTSLMRLAIAYLERPAMDGDLVARPGFPSGVKNRKGPGRQR